MSSEKLDTDDHRVEQPDTTVTSQRQRDAEESLKILLDTVKAEYEAEQARADTFEVRSGILLTLLSALLVYEATSFVLPDNVGVRLASVIVASEIISVLSLVASILLSIRVLLPMDFVRVEPKNFNNLETFGQPPSVLMMRIIDAYSASVEHASRQIPVRGKFFTSAIWMSMIGVVALVISRIIQVFAT